MSPEKEASARGWIDRFQAIGGRFLIVAGRTLLDVTHVADDDEPRLADLLTLAVAFPEAFDMIKGIVADESLAANFEPATTTEG